MGVCIAPLPSPTLLIRVGSHIAARIQPPLSGNTNGPSDALKVLLVKELWVVTRRGEERREEQRGEERGLAFPVKRKKLEEIKSGKQLTWRMVCTSKVVGVRCVHVYV